MKKINLFLVVFLVSTLFGCSKFQTDPEMKYFEGDSKAGNGFVLNPEERDIASVILIDEEGVKDSIIIGNSNVYIEFSTVLDSFKIDESYYYIVGQEYIQYSFKNNTLLKLGNIELTVLGAEVDEDSECPRVDFETSKVIDGAYISLDVLFDDSIQSYPFRQTYYYSDVVNGNIFSIFVLENNYQVFKEKFDVVGINRVEVDYCNSFYYINVDTFLFSNVDLQ